MAARRHPGSQPTKPAATGFVQFCGAEAFVPHVNVFETPRAYLICMDLGGMERDEIEVVAAGSKLTVRGTRKVPRRKGALADSDTVRVHVMEIDHGPFQRNIELPDDMDPAKIEAYHDNGMLWIEVGKRGQDAGRK